jgi:hypothetical protein
VAARGNAAQYGRTVDMPHDNGRTVDMPHKSGHTVDMLHDGGRMVDTREQFRTATVYTQLEV